MSDNNGHDIEYDPADGHTREEADEAYRVLFRELHGEELQSIQEYGAYSISTKMAYEYLARGVTPDPETAKRMCTDIITDTKMFREEGTTQADRLAAVALANIAGIDIAVLASDLGIEV